MRYVTPAEMRAWVGIDSPEVILDASIAAAEGLIDDWCGQQFDQTAAVARLFVAYSPWVLNLPPPSRISTTDDLDVETDDAGDGTFGTTWASSDYQLEPTGEYVSGVQRPWRTLRSVGGRAFPTLYGRATVRITARWGWVEVPAAVKHATLIVATDLFKAKDSAFGIAGFGEFGAVRVGSRINPQAQALLSPYVENARLA